jgi:DNA-binding CsgD family transcriptional regulator
MKNRRILRKRDGLSMTGRVIEAADPVVSKRLARSIAVALGVDGAVRSGDSMLCPRPSAKRPYVVHVIPSGYDDAGAPRALVVLLDPEELSESLSSKLYRRFGLRHGEAEVASRVSGGDSVRTVADELSLLTATVAAHLHSAMDKTQTRRQLHLRRLLRSITR